MEPGHTAVLLVLAAVLLLLAALATRMSGRFGVPSLLFFLILGLLARAVPLHVISLPGAHLSFEIGTVALILILFDGGLNTPAAAARSVAGPALSLALLGTFLTAAIVAGIGHQLGLSPPIAILMGAIVSSTDVAAVFSTLRSSESRLREKVGLTLELESALNDPMAVMLTMAATEALVGEHTTGFGLVLGFLIQLGGGVLVGFAFGYAGRWLLAHASLPVSGLYPVLTVAIAFSSYGVATLLQGSGFLAVALTAMVLSSGRMPYRAGTLRVHDGLAWLAQIVMFLMLGLTVTPVELARQVVQGAVLAIGLAVVARPAAVFACLAPFKFTFRERLFIAATGLRGAVPIVLATYPLIRGVSGAHELFNLVFVMVGFNNIIPGAIARPLARRLGMRRQMPPPPPAGIEMVSRSELEGEFVAYYVDAASAAAGALVQELPLPDSSLVTLIVRGHEVLAPRGPTRIEPGDHVYVFTKPADKSLTDLLFGYVE